MTSFVYYKTHAKILRHYLCESPKEMWASINKVLNKGYTVTEVNIYDNSHGSDNTLCFDAQGEPYLKPFRTF